MFERLGAFLAVVSMAMFAQPAFANTSAKLIEIKGEVIDTWCYFSGVMGGEDAVIGSAHHTCALWCAAGGIPVGVLTEEGEVFMVLKYQGEDVLEKTDTLMEVQSDIITAKGMHYVRDGVNYIVVENVIANDGIQVLNHEDYGSVPPNSFPKNYQ
ncbi:MAG: hypothetical protein QNJ29_05330 [Rhizobiaceae bacterium]|nr:hypothetical protein [Rhizobiaceae bacterium]